MKRRRYAPRHRWTPRHRAYKLPALGCLTLALSWVSLIQVIWWVR
jgi:hypothetical protein